MKNSIQIIVQLLRVSFDSRSTPRGIVSLILLLVLIVPL